MPCLLHRWNGLPGATTTSCQASACGAVAELGREAAKLGEEDLAERGDAAVVDAGGGPGHGDRGHDRPVDTADRSGDRGQPQLQLVERRGPAAAAYLDQRVVELCPVDRGVRGAALEVALRQRERAEGVEHLAQRRAVGRYVHTH